MTIIIFTSRLLHWLDGSPQAPLVKICFPRKDEKSRVELRDEMSPKPILWVQLVPLQNRSVSASVSLLISSYSDFSS